MEGTYAMEDHPIRDGLEKEFVQKVTEVVEGGGTVLVPAFGVGRSQELLSVLSAYHFEHPVFVDGMALDAMEMLLKYPSSLRDSSVFERASKMAHWVDGWTDRRRAAKNSPSGPPKNKAWTRRPRKPGTLSRFSAPWQRKNTGPSSPAHAISTL